MRLLLMAALSLILGACGGANETDCEGADCPCVGVSCDPDPETEEGCLLVAEEGTCTGLYSVAHCVKKQGRFEVEEKRCVSGEACQVGLTGAYCKPMASCVGDTGYCTAEGNMRSCEDRTWVETPCADGCSDARDGPHCREPQPGLELVRAEVTYDHFLPAEDLRGWVSEVRPAAGMRVLSVRGETVLDSAIVREDGSFEILAPEAPGPDDTIRFLAFHRLLGRESAGYAVVRPGLPPGTYPPALPQNASSWSWSFEWRDPPEFHIGEAEGGGAIQVFQAMRATVEHVAGIRGPSLLDLVAIYEPEVDFDCEACFVGAQTSGYVFVSGGRSPGHRSDAALYLQSAHYAFGMLGGRYHGISKHCFGVPTPPGQAFSQGYAHWYSADRRRDGRFFAEDDGVILTWELDARSPAELFRAPILGAGPKQAINESWIAATLWQLAKDHGESLPLHMAVSAPEMREPLASGNTSKFWMEVDEACQPIDPQDSGHWAPVLSDYLDALLCRQFPSEPVEELVSPHYPYEPRNPSCK